MSRPVRKTIEYGDNDLYLRFLFQEASGKRHWTIHKMCDMGNRKAEALGTCSLVKDNSPQLSVVWNDKKV